MRIIKSYWLSCIFAVIFIVSAHPAFAEQPELQYEDYIYENATMEKLSQLYWALDRLDIEDDQHIENYLRINECDLYEKYHRNEFEWTSVKEAARKFIEQNRAAFPLRFAITQRIRLGEYDFENEQFPVSSRTIVDGVRRFEMVAAEASNCDIPNYLSGYPDGVIVELSRPIVFDALKMPPDEARRFLEKKQEAYYSSRSSNRDSPRDIYLVLNVKFFSSKGEVKIRGVKQLRANLLGVLEGIKVYSTSQKTELLFQENYLRKKTDRVLTADLSQEFYKDFVEKRNKAKAALDQKRRLDEEAKAEKEENKG